MNTRVLVGVGFASVALAVSCMQDRGATPLLPTQPSYAKPVGGSCVASSTMNSNAKAYFADWKDPVFALIDSVQKYYAAANTAQTNAYGYQALIRVAYVANAPVSDALVAGTPAQGSTFANNLLGCMTVDGYTSSIDFAPALSDSGLFAVRSDSRLEPAVSRKQGAHGPLFGAERKDAASTSWYARYGTAPYTGPILFYGSQLSNAGTFNNEPTVGVTFDISSLPSPLSFLKLNLATTPVDTEAVLQVGVCDMTSSAGQILHEHGGTTILPNNGDPRFCALSEPPQIGMVRSPFSSFAFAANRVASWFTPEPLYAFIAFGGSGSYGGLSKGGAVTFDVTQSGITFSTPPRNSKLSANPQFVPPIAVKVVTTNGNPVAGVGVTLSVVGNSGSFTPPSDSYRETDEQGIATFYDFYLDKAGGYTITATTVYGSITSKLFQISGK
jgi:hypothetical protein